ncbi:thioester-containing protein 1 allele R1-like [Musca vetustissima]|uniref:thioester-containing protein 1 allele R1-like n=1 Tax=Musca vetustissima TaxID=27455 RepID=UPI002AB63556|nr:thioester-containing protein 1 allele R1-like [Musca vetustissima]
MPLNVEPVDTEVTLYNEKEEFYFMESTIFNKDVGSSDQRRSRKLKIAANSVATTAFLINPRQVGKIRLQVTATNSLANDGIIEMLRVEPEGILIKVNEAVFSNVVPNAPIEFSYPINISDAEIIPNSEYITMSVVGDNMVPVLQNLNDLLRQPTGCGEQNMANFAPNVLVLQYLRSTGQYHKERELVAKARRYIEIGFQQQLTYRHKNGGYSVFGQRKDTEPSTWLTAYTIRFFIKSLKYTMSMESHIIESGLDYLAKAQRDDGSFPYTGYLIYPAQQNRYGFTAFVLMTFIEEQKYARNYTTTIERGLGFLKEHLDQINDLYALSIMAVTLQMAKDKSNSKKILDKLLSRRQVDNDSMWWTQNDRNKAKDVEITGYILIALLEAGNAEEDCGFKSSQDTVVGLQALIKYSMKYKTGGDINILLNYTAMDGDRQVLEVGEIIVNENNVKVLQTEELPKTTRLVEIQISGLGTSLLQLAYHYYTTGAETFQYFQIEPKVEVLNPGEISLEICFSYIEPNSEATNMIVMEINLPSGYSVNEEDSDYLMDNEIVQRVETKNSATTIIVYSEKLKANVKNCLNILAYKMHDVVHRKATSIIVYDYYDVNRHDTVFYNIYKEAAQDGNEL